MKRLRDTDAFRALTRNLSLRQLGTLFGCSHTTVRKIQQGEAIGVDLAKRVAGAVKVSLDVLFEDAVSPAKRQSGTLRATA